MNAVNELLEIPDWLRAYNRKAIAEAIVVASACELMRYRNPYERGSPAQKAWSELLGAVRQLKRKQPLNG